MSRYREKDQTPAKKLGPGPILPLDNVLIILKKSTKSIRALVKDIHEENMTMLDNYMAKDRSTRKRKTIDYDTYASYSE